MDWDQVFGYRKRLSQVNKKFQQNNRIKSMEALGDEAGNKSSDGDEDGVTPLPKHDDSDQNLNKDSNSDDSSSNQDDDSSQPQAGGGDDDSGGGDDNADSSGDGGDNGDSSSDSSSTDSSSSMGGDSEEPKSGDDPLRNINGDIRMISEIRAFISEVASVLESLERSNIKSVIISKIEDLKTTAQLLVESVPLISLEDTMVRYELLVRQYEELVSSLKKS